MINFDFWVWIDTAVIVAFFTFIGVLVQFVINPLINNYLDKKKENSEKSGEKNNAVSSGIN